MPRPVLIAHFFSDLHYLSQWYSPEGPEGKTLLAEQITELFLRSIAARMPQPGAATGPTDA